MTLSLLESAALADLCDNPEVTTFTHFLRDDRDFCTFIDDDEHLHVVDEDLQGR